MAATIYLIRHGETEDAEEKRYKGHIDVPLSANGIKQIQRLSEYIVHYCSSRSNSLNSSNRLNSLNGLNAVYSSGLSRALKSAEIIAEPFKLKPVVIENLKERSFGVWEGMTFSEIEEKYPDAFRAWADNPLEYSPIEGENTLDVRDRALKAWNEIIRNHMDEAIAIVSHGGIIRVILCEMLGVPLENIFKIEQDFGALNIIELWDYPTIRCLNYVVK
ncbi:MAG: histidine phosphatase family protein [Nitrospiraceae bacterium]|nr:MAG: histidine phosphatase family protein [Nitrospiraceae bacterium]